MGVVSLILTLTFCLSFITPYSRSAYGIQAHLISPPIPTNLPSSSTSAFSPTLLITPYLPSPALSVCLLRTRRAAFSSPPCLLPVTAHLLTVIAHRPDPASGQLHLVAHPSPTSADALARTRSTKKAGARMTPNHTCYEPIPRRQGFPNRRLIPLCRRLIPLWDAWSLQRDA